MNIHIAEIAHVNPYRMFIGEDHANTVIVIFIFSVLTYSTKTSLEHLFVVNVVVNCETREHVQTLIQLHGKSPTTRPAITYSFIDCNRHHFNL